MSNEAVSKPIIDIKKDRELVELIKRTIAPDATDDELALFLYQANRMKLDPLAGQIYLLKFRNSDGTSRISIGISIDGMRSKATDTGKLQGIQRGISTDKDGNEIRDKDGYPVRAWAEVYREGWTKPAREEVTFKEYARRNKDGSLRQNWKDMPDTMLKKCAEAAALRMAFPIELSGVYIPEEVDAPVREIKEAKNNTPTQQIENEKVRHEDLVEIAKKYRLDITDAPERIVMTEYLEKETYYELAKLLAPMGYKYHSNEGAFVLEGGI
ncbi:MAG: phage recombination protein Bet [Candidatus Parvarchaeota archaeon]